MDNKEAAALIDAFKIPRATIARLADVHSPTLSSYLNGTIDISQDKVERISAWTADVAKTIQAMGMLGIKVDLTDIDNVRQLVQKINDTEKQLMLPLDGVLQDLRQLPPLANGESAVA